MPVSHIGLTVSHLPTSCSFFLSALQPLGYRYIGQQGNQIGLGIHDADFFICQETPGVKAGAAHIAFTAPSRTAVRDFYTAALTAGARPNGAPASRTDQEDHFNAAVLDLDGNSIEVVFRNGPDLRDDGTVIEHSRVITWQRSVVEGYRDDRSVVSSRTTQSMSKQALVPVVAKALSKAPTVVSEAPSAASKPPSIARSATEPVIPQAVKSSDAGDGAAKKIIGTLLGAAAGAAVAYAMVKSESDSAKKEAEFGSFMEAKAQVSKLAQMAQTKDQPQLSMQDPQPIYATAPKSVVSAHRNIEAESYYSSQRSAHGQPRAIEAAPESYHAPFYTSAPPTQISERRAIEYAPAHSVAPSRTQFSTHRSKTSPELLTYEKARSTVSAASKPPSVAHSVAASTLISSFVPDEAPRRASEGSVHSHHSSKSRARSSHTSASRHTSSRSRAPSPPPASKAASKVGSKAASIVGSILGRDAKSSASQKEDLIDDFEIDDFNDTDTVAPSDSISNAGSSHRRRHRSHGSKHSSGSTVSKHSSASRHSKSSRHSSHSQHSHSSRRSKREGSEYHDADERRRPSVISEPSEASTVKPYKPSSSKVGRKDSVTQGQYDGMFDESVQYGTGNVASIPIRGLTPSMVGSKVGSKAGVENDNKSRGMITYAMGQKLRPFED